jgi:hypothetical protein
MKPLVFKKNSWHYWVARQGGLYSWGDSDICTYTSRFLLGALRVIGAGSLFVTMVVAIITWIGMFLYGAYLFATLYDTQLTIQYFIENVLATHIQRLAAKAFHVTAIVGTICLVALTIFFGTLGVRKLLSRPKKHDSFVAEAVRAAKNKTCVKVKFE